jgi:hypothetical protein
MDPIGSALCSNRPEGFGAWAHTPHVSVIASLSNRQKDRQISRYRRGRISFKLMIYAHKYAYNIGKKIGKNAYKNGH